MPTALLSATQAPGQIAQLLNSEEHYVHHQVVRTPRNPLACWSIPQGQIPTLYLVASSGRTASGRARLPESHGGPLSDCAIIEYRRTLCAPPGGSHAPQPERVEHTPRSNTHSTLSHLLTGRLPGARAFLNHMADPSCAPPGGSHAPQPERVEHTPRSNTHSTLSHLLTGRLPGARAFLNHMADPSEFIDNDAFTALLLLTCLLDPLPGLAHFSHKCTLAYGSNPYLSPCVVYAHRETMLPRLPGLSDQAVGSQDLHQHCRSDIALQVQQTEPDGGPTAAILNAQGDSLQHLDIVTASAGSKTACISPAFNHRCCP